MQNTLFITEMNDPFKKFGLKQLALSTITAEVSVVGVLRPNVCTRLE